MSTSHICGYLYIFSVELETSHFSISYRISYNISGQEIVVSETAFAVHFHVRILQYQDMIIIDP